MIKTIIFDAGDVLLDTGKKGTVDEISELLETDIKRTRIEYEKIKEKLQRGEISEDELWRILSKRMKVKLPKKYKGYLEKKFSRRIKKKEDVYSIAKRLKEDGYKIAVFSNTFKFHAKVHKKKKHYKIFSPVILSCEVKMRKPETRIYRYVLKGLGVKGEECVFIDNEKNFLLPAKKLGFKTILFKSAEQLKRELNKLV